MFKEKIEEKASDKAFQILKQDQRLFHQLEQKLSPAILCKMCQFLDDEQFREIVADQAELRVTLATAIVHLLRQRHSESSDVLSEILIQDVEQKIAYPQDSLILFLDSESRKRKTGEFDI